MAPLLPHFANTLLFRFTAGCLLLITICLGGYYFWIENEILTTFGSESEEDWYLNLAEGELDSLAVLAADGAADLEAYGARIAPFGAEVIVFDAGGAYVASTDPDSLGGAVPAAPADLLAAMSRDDWDYAVFPDTIDVNAYVNRIFEVDRIEAGDAGPAGFLVASYRPVDSLSGDLNADTSLLATQDRIFKALTALLIISALLAMVLMTVTGRRVQQLSRAVAAFAAGDFSRRVPVRSRDEIGILGRNFNVMAERIEDMVDELRRQEEFQRQLIANVSHDLRTPLASIQGYVETMVLDGEKVPEADRQRFLNIVAGNLNHLERLVEHMLILSRFDSGQATCRMENFPPAELADETLLRCEGLAAERDISLELEVGDGVGLVCADPIQLAQVLQNLVENGIKFNRPGGRVTIAISREREQVRIAVRDTGIGIPPEERARIFDRFYTGDRSRTRNGELERQVNGRHLAQNSGLGLAIATKILSLHDSTLEVESEVGKGSVFHFTLRRVADDRQDATAG